MSHLTEQDRLLGYAPNGTAQWRMYREDDVESIVAEHIAAAKAEVVKTVEETVSAEVEYHRSAEDFDATVLCRDGEWADVGALLRIALAPFKEPTS